MSGPWGSLTPFRLGGRCDVGGVNGTEPADAHVRRTIDREVELLMSAVYLVASGGAPSTMVVGLRLTDAVIAIVRPIAAERGLVLEPLWGSGGHRRRARRRGEPDAMIEPPRHVLLVEDDEPLAGILSAHLRARGYKVTVSGTAEDAS